MGNIRAIILAAGESKRMGAPKMLLPYKGKSVIEQVVYRVFSVLPGNITVVLGANSQAVRQVLGNYPVDFCINEKYTEGMFSSVLCGLAQAPPQTEAVMLFLGDQPEVEISVIQAVIDAWVRGSHGIVVPSAEGKRGHPLLFAAKYIPEITTFDPAEGMKALRRRFPDDVAEVAVENKSILTDLDTPEDYELAINTV
jgi:molybdenum cofactor cytidylyltransferase